MIKRLAALASVAMILSSASFVSAETPATGCPVAIGKPYRIAASPTVFVVTDGCEKRPVFNPDVYFSHFSSFSAVKVVSPATLASIPDSPLRFLPWGPLRAFGNGSLVKTVSDPKVYLLIGSSAYPFKDELAFKALGYDFAQVEDVTPEVLAKYETIRFAIQGTKNVPEFLVFKYPDSPDVFVIRKIDGGELKRTRISSMEELKRIARADRIAVLPKSRTFPIDASPIDGVPPSEPAASAPMNMPDMTMPAAPSTGTMTYIDRASIPTGLLYQGLDFLKIVTIPFFPTASDVGAFRSQCEASHFGFNDPLVFPGQAGASHLHVFFGNQRADQNLAAGHLRDAGTTGSCAGGNANLSGYWVPALIDAHGKPIVPVRNIVYYKSGYGGVKPEDIHEFPEGLRMIAGDAKATSTQEHAYWGCGEVYIGHPGSIPKCPPGTEFIEMTVEFPQCWDGVHLDSADHKSHMAYPHNGCPADHPVAIPAISFNIRYKVSPDQITGLRLSSDMYSKDQPGGFSAHGDWWDGWNHDIVKKWMKSCVNAGRDCGGGTISDDGEYLEY